MTAQGVTAEFAKMRRLRLGPLVAVMVVGVVGLSCREITAPGFFEAVRDPSGLAWRQLLGGAALAAPLVSPILIAVLASRQVDLEHQGGGWLFSHTVGFAAGRLCRMKFLATGAVLAAATVLECALIVGAGALAGITADLPAGRWAAYTASLVAVNLVLLAVHLLLAARVENQLVGVGIGILGVFLAVSGTGMPAWAAHLTPWGYYALATPVDYRGEVLVPIDPWHLSIAALATISAVAFLFVTRLLDRKED